MSDEKTIILLSALFDGGGDPSSTGIGVFPGDYEMLPANKTFALAYFQYTHSDAYFSQDKKAAGDYRSASEATLLRFIHGIRPSENISIEPQVILPFVRATTMGDASPLGNASGMGDIIAGIPFKFRVGHSGRDILALAPFIYVPVGAYRNERAVNIGENRWRYLLQGVWIHHFNDHWAMDTGADVSRVSDNDDYGINHSTRPAYPLRISGLSSLQSEPEHTIRIWRAGSPVRKVG